MSEIGSGMSEIGVLLPRFFENLVTFSIEVGRKLKNAKQSEKLDKLHLSQGINVSKSN